MSSGELINTILAVTLLIVVLYADNYFDKHKLTKNKGE